MKNKRDLKINALVFSTLLFIVIFAVGWYAAGKYQQSLAKERHLLIVDELRNKANAIEQAINTRLSLLYGVRAFVNATGHLYESAPDEFARESSLYLRIMHQNIPDVRSVSISPDAIHKYIYPLTERTRKTLGHNLLTDKRAHVRDKVKQTIASGLIGLSGPYRLRQDGTLALIARLPIYRDQVFWGLTAMVVEIAPILADLHLLSSGLGSADFALRVKGGRVFYGPPRIFEKSSYVQPITLPDGQWELAILVDEDGYAKGLAWILRVLNAVMSLLLGALFYVLGSRQNFLQHKIDTALAEAAEERVLAEQSEKRFQQLIKQAPIPLCIVDPDGVITYFNDRFNELFGYSHADVPTLTEWWQLAYPDPTYRSWVLETWNAAIEKAAREGTDIEPVEYQVTCKNGEVLTVEISGITFDEMFLATFIDLTDRKKAEAELTRHRDNLEEIVQERTREIQRALNLMAGREVRMAGLKKSIKILREQLIAAKQVPLVDDSYRDGQE